MTNNPGQRFGEIQWGSSILLIRRSSTGPAYFQVYARLWQPALEAIMQGLEVPPNGYKLFRTAVIGKLAIHAANENPSAWSASGLNLIQRYSDNANKLMPHAFREGVAKAAAALWYSLQEQIKEGEDSTS